jgi:D-alanyl-lipoteichoic acid acyltransferase DltB (MBOAT superfamily)
MQVIIEMKGVYHVKISYYTFSCLTRILRFVQRKDACRMRSKVASQHITGSI